MTVQWFQHPRLSSPSTIYRVYTYRVYTMQRRLSLFLLVLLGMSFLPTAAQAQSTAGVTTTPLGAANRSAPEWLEPRGISVVDLVGAVPETHLVDAIISSRVGLGIVQYVSGSRSGDTVTINVRFSPRYWTDGTNWATLFGCLGKPAIDDEWPVAVPPASMRVYENGNEVTAQVSGSYDYVPAGQNQPDNNGTGWWRYVYLWGQRTQFNEDGSVAVPANMGCGYSLPGRLTNLTATFVLNAPAYLTVEEIDSETFMFHSYIGVGNSGQVGSLNDQMNRRYGHRHDKFDLTIPDGADHAFVKFPPTPVDPYMGQPEINVFLNSSGTYRINGAGNTLSVDHVNSMAIPIFGQWQDADQSGGTFLNFFDSAGRLAAPEYFVPTNIPYDPCMTNGNCSSDLLEQIYHAEMPMTIYYYRIVRIREGLERVPLRQVGPGWNTAASADAVAQAAGKGMDDPRTTSITAALEQGIPLEALHAPAQPTASTQRDAPSDQQRQRDLLIYLPLVFSAEPPPAELPEGDRSGCPCGWFDGYGRMFDFVPGP
ncbi:MAG: hypothetical protein KDE19_12455 [Caldilineaceae bacterium]|nr:hypothetical protein [Caldilineaceae bacterium]